jgi:hypothetical protein
MSEALPARDDDARRLRTATDESVRYRFLTGRWPTAGDLDDLRRRHAADPDIRAVPLVDVMHALLGVPDRRAV